MSVREVLGPSSFDQIVYVILLWALAIVSLSYFYDTPLVRLEVIAGTVIILTWVIWAVKYRLQQIRCNWNNR